jgi:hypothetical protein
MDLKEKERICRCYQEKLTREETFCRLCTETGLPPVSLDQSTQFFKECDENTDVSIDSIYFDLLDEILYIFDKIPGTVSSFWIEKSDTICLLNSNLALVLRLNRQKGFHILDICHGQMK